MRLSIIIPTFNEEKQIGECLGYLLKYGGDAIEILVVDGGSTDKTETEVAKFPVIFLKSPKRGRPAQLNYGASQAKEDLLYFIHSDSYPAKSFLEDIRIAREEGYQIGSYQSKYDANIKALKLNEYFTKFNWLVSRGGDQTIFVTKDLFNDLEGFKENYCIMEDFEFLKRARKKTKFKVMEDAALISARKYEVNSYFRVNFANFIVFNMFRFGASPERMRNTYNKLLRDTKY